MKRCEDCIHMNICGYYAEFKEIDNDCRWYKGKADFAEVVRCKDCKHYTSDIICEDVGWCEKMERGFYKDNFCNYGERKGGAE